MSHARICITIWPTYMHALMQGLHVQASAAYPVLGQDCSMTKICTVHSCSGHSQEDSCWEVSSCCDRSHPQAHHHSHHHTSSCHLHLAPHGLKHCNSRPQQSPGTTVPDSSPHHTGSSPTVHHKTNTINREHN